MIWFGGSMADTSDRAGPGAAEPVASEVEAPEPASSTSGEGDDVSAGWRARLAKPVHPPTGWEKLLYTVVHFISVRVWCRLWFRLEVVDRSWVPASGPFVVAPVHRSNIDFLLVGALTGKRMRYIGKDSLWRWAPLGRFISALGAFPVRRGAADREALRICMQVIENGEPLVMFPEGTRRTGPVVEEVFAGPAYVAARTGVPLVPVGIGGSEQAMPKGTKWIRPRKVVLVVGEPINPPKGDGTGRVPRRVVRSMTDQLRSDIQALYDEAQQIAS
jgi:1-acyl-sn-glycerol-3-phosphate acyltransferase